MKSGVPRLLFWSTFRLFSPECPCFLYAWHQGAPTQAYANAFPAGQRRDWSITLWLNRVAMLQCLNMLENMHSCAYSSSEFRDSYLPLQQTSSCTKANRYRLTWE